MPPVDPNSLRTRSPLLIVVGIVLLLAGLFAAIFGPEFYRSEKHNLAQHMVRISSIPLKLGATPIMAVLDLQLHCGISGVRPDTLVIPPEIAARFDTERTSSDLINCVADKMSFSDYLSQMGSLLRAPADVPVQPLPAPLSVAQADQIPDYRWQVAIDQWRLQILENLPDACNRFFPGLQRADGINWIKLREQRNERTRMTLSKSPKRVTAEKWKEAPYRRWSAHLAECLEKLK